MALQLRRGTNKERLQITPAEGELIFVTDWQLATLTVTAVDSTTDFYTCVGHGLNNGDQILFQGTTTAGYDLTNNTAYYIRNKTTDTFQLSLTSSGALQNPTTTASGLTLTFAKTPTTAAGVPVGTNVTALWIGDGSTVGGIAGNTQGLDDLSDVEITTPSEGQILYYDGTEWINTSTIATSVANNRLTFQYDNSTAGINSAIILRKDYGAGSYTDGDGVGIKFELDKNADPDPVEFMTVNGVYNATAPIFAVYSSTNDGSSYQTVAQLSKDLANLPSALRIGGNSIQNSAGSEIIKFNTLEVELIGDLQIDGNIIRNSTGNNIIVMDTGSTGLTTFSGDIQVQGNSIKASDGNINIQMTSMDLTEVKGDLQVSGDDIQNGLGNKVIRFTGTLDTTLTGNLQINGGSLTTNQTTMNVFNTTATTVNAFGAATAVNIGNAAGTTTINGNLVVNGTTTTVNSTTLTVDDKNIELASTASPSDTAADGGGITLKGNTDKKIFWQNSDDRWYFDNGDGNNYRIAVNLDDLADVTTPSSNKGQVLYYDGSAWVNTSTIQFDNAAYRPRFQSNIGASTTISSGLIAVKNTGGTAYTDGDGSGILIAVDDDSNPIKIFAGLSAAYSSTGNHEARLRSSTDAFATVDKNLLAVNDDDLKVRAKEFILNAEGSGSAGVDAQITVERGTTGTDSYIKWDETNDFWVASNGFKSEGNITADADLIANGNLTLNNDGGTNNVVITFKDGPGPTNKTITWSDANNQFEISDQLYVNGDIYTSDDKITINADDTAADSYLYFNTTENLKWDYANTKFVFSDDLEVGGNFTATGDLIADGNLTLNNDGTTADVVITFKDGPTPTNRTLKWAESNTRFEFDAYLYATEGTFGSVDVGRTSGQIDTNGGVNLTLDSDGGTVLINDNLNVDSGTLYVDAANNYVGINDATPGKALDVVGEIRSDTSVLTPEVELNSAATLDAFTTTTASTSQFTLADTTGDVLKVIIHMSLGTQRHCVEALAMKYGASTAGLTTYAELNTVAGGAPIANFAADVSSGSLRILATPTSSSTTTFKVVRTQIA